jgi:hypothetical protein
MRKSAYIVRAQSCARKAALCGSSTRQLEGTGETQSVAQAGSQNEASIDARAAWGVSGRAIEEAAQRRCRHGSNGSVREATSRRRSTSSGWGRESSIRNVVAAPIRQCRESWLRKTLLGTRHCAEAPGRESLRTRWRCWDVELGGTRWEVGVGKTTWNGRVGN